MRNLVKGLLFALTCAATPLLPGPSIFPEYGKPVVLHGSMSFEQPTEAVDYHITFELELVAQPNAAGDKDEISLKFNALNVVADAYKAIYEPHRFLPYWLYARRVGREHETTLTYTLPLKGDEWLTADDVVGELQELFDWSWHAKVDYQGKRCKVDDPEDELHIERLESYILADEVTRHIPWCLFQRIRYDQDRLDDAPANTELSVEGDFLILRSTSTHEEKCLAWNVNNPCDFYGSCLWSSPIGIRIYWTIHSSENSEDSRPSVAG